MDWDSLRVFLTVARSGRVSAAARQLAVEHTTISRRLAALEDALGVPLFYRTAGGYLLTPHGHGVLGSAQAMERAALAIGARAREESGAMAGRVRVALIPDYAAHWLAPRVPAFTARYPGIELEILAGTRQLDLSRGEADLAVRAVRPRQTGLSARRLVNNYTGLYAARRLIGQRRLRVRDAPSLRGLPLLIYAPEHEVLQQAPWFRALLPAARVAMRSNSTDTLLGAALAGVGVAVLPHFVARRHEELVGVSDDLGGGTVWLVTHPEFRRDPRVRATAEFLRSIAADINEAR